MKKLSVVNIIPNNHLEPINSLAEAYGCGSNNISVPLCNKNGEITHYGCHSWWTEDDYTAFTSDEVRVAFISSLDPSLQPLFTNAIEHLYERVVEDGVPLENWNEALMELNLTEVPCETLGD